METLWIVLISVAVGALLLYRLLGPRDAWDFDASSALLGELEERRDRVLREIRGLDLELRAGALSAEEHEERRSEKRQRAILLLQEMDAVRRRQAMAADGAERLRRVDELVANRKESP